MVTLAGVDRMLVVAAHPDDETLGAGGLLHLAGRAGVRVDLLVATDGEASHPSSPTHGPALLAARRRSELAAAVTGLHPGARVERLGLPDSGLAAHVGTLTAAVARRLAGVDLVVSTWERDGHPDHEAVGRAVVDAGAGTVWQFPIWAWHWTVPDWTGLDLVRVTLDEAARTAKAAAIAAHVSQVAPLSDRPGDEQLLTDDVLAHFTGSVETFVRYRGTP